MSRNPPPSKTVHNIRVQGMCMFLSGLKGCTCVPFGVSLGSCLWPPVSCPCDGCCLLPFASTRLLPSQLSLSSFPSLLRGRPWPLSLAAWTCPAVEAVRAVASMHQNPSRVWSDELDWPGPGSLGASPTVRPALPSLPSWPPWGKRRSRGQADSRPPLSLAHWATALAPLLLQSIRWAGSRPTGLSRSQSWGREVEDAGASALDSGRALLLAARRCPLVWCLLFFS